MIRQRLNINLFSGYDSRYTVQYAWKVLLLYIKQGASLDDPKPGAVIAVQTFGDFLNFNPATAKQPAILSILAAELVSKKCFVRHSLQKNIDKQQLFTYC